MDEKKYNDGVDLSARITPSSQSDRSWTFDLSAIFLAIFGAVISYHGFNLVEWEFLLVGIVGLIASVSFFVWPEVLRRRSQDIKTFNENLHDLKTMMADLDTIRKEHNRARAAYERSREVWESGGAQLVDSMNSLMSQVGGVSKYEQQLIQVRQEAGELSRHLDTWREISIEHVDFLDRTLGFDDLDENYRSAVEKSRREFVRGLEKLGLTEIAPALGDEFDDRLHHADGVKEKDGIKPGCVSGVIEVGFATGNRIIRPAKVTITPE